MPLNRDNPSASQWTEEELLESDRQVMDCIRKSSEFLTSLEQRCPRDVVILGTSKVDLELKHLLRKVIDGTSEVTEDRLFNPDRALGTYAARCDLCFRLRLIDETFLRVLRLYGKIRNKYAHHSGDLSLLESPLKDWLQEIENVVCANDYPGEQGERFKKAREHPYYRFTIPLGLILNILLRLQYETPQFLPAFTGSLHFFKGRTNNGFFCEPFSAE